MVHLQVHSHYSLLEGTAKPRQLLARAVEYGMRALALTDTNGLYGAIPFYQAAREIGIRPLVGVRLGGTVFLAKNREGYAELCDWVTRAQTGTADIRRLDTWAFVTGFEQVFAITADRALLQAWRGRGLQPLVAVTQYGDAASRYRAEGQVAWAKAQGLRAVAVSPVYFLDPEHYAVHRALSAIKHNTTVDALTPQETARPGDWFRSPKQLERLYGEWPALLDTAEWVAEECDLDLPLGKPLFPACEVPEGETDYSWLSKLTFDGLRARYRPCGDAVRERARYELEIIHRLGFAPYFLIVSDIVRFAQSRAIPVVGRGSAANSVVAYALGITRVDPFQYGLYFERFLNPARTDCPDIDLDIAWDRRDEVLEYVYARHGADRVAMIGTINTFRGRSAWQEVAKVFGVTERRPRGAVAGELHERIAKIAGFIEGFPHHLSIHAGGVVIAPEPLTRYVPLQHTPKGLLITQYEMHAVETLGLVKMDLLGHRALSVIRDAARDVRAYYGSDFDIETIPDADPRTAALLRTGQTLGCFQIESPAMRGLLQKIQACDVHTLIQAIALVRPGAAGSGMKQHFIDRHHGREPVAYPHASLETVLRETYGVMIYQEDVLKVAHAVAGMTLAEADALRRAMSKKRGPREMAKSMKQFLEKAQAHGVDAASAQEIWELIANFAAYSYCKAHASTYGELAYQCAYLKAHFPAEFFAAVLTNRGGFYPPPVYLEEAKRCGLEIRPPHIQRSAYEYTAEDGAVRMGLLEIRNLEYRAAQAILEARRARPFAGLADLLERAPIARADAEALCQAGAFDAFGLTRPAQYWQIKRFFAERPNAPHAAQRSLFALAAPDAPRLPDYSAHKRAQIEWDTLGMLARRHPLDFYLPRLHTATAIASTALPAYDGKTVTLVGWLIAERSLAVKSGNGAMKFITLEDCFGTYEAVLFPEAHERYGALLLAQGPFRVTGRVQNEHGAYTICAERIEREGVPLPGASRR